MTHLRNGGLEPALPMANSDEIHHSIADADDIEEIHEEIAVADVFRNLLHHPAQISTRWNWKTALVGALVRSSFYFTVYLASRESWLVTITAVLVELSFRFFTTGAAGAVVQSFRRATPQWLATAIISISLPTITHIIEFFTHYVQEHYFSGIFPASQNDARQKTFAVSVLFSVISAMFNLYMMRHGVLLVGAGEESKPILQDFKKMPVLVKDFTIYLPAFILRLVDERRIFSALGLFAFFGLAVGGILGTTRGVWNWAYRSALGAWALLLFSIIVGAIVMHFRKKRRLARGEAS